MAGRKFEPTNINGLKFFKGTLYGPAEDLPEAKRRFRLMNQEEMDRYDRKVDESKGFDVDGCTGAMPGRIVPISPKSGEWQVAESLARWAVDKQLRRGGNPLESISVVKVNLQPVRGGMFYITLTAFDTADGETKTYRAKVWHGIWEYKLMYFEEFPEKTGTSYKARASKSRSKISKAKKGKAVQSSGGVLLGFNALLRKIKSQNPSMTHTMARKAASKNWKLLSNAKMRMSSNSSTFSHSTASSMSHSSWIWVDCKCHVKATLRVVKNGGKHEGRRFYGCGKFADDNHCNFFKWEEDVKSEKLKEQREIIDELVVETYGKSELLKKKHKLKQKWMSEMTDLKVKSEVHAKGERRALIALGLSWVFFAYYLVFCPLTVYWIRRNEIDN